MKHIPGAILAVCIFAWMTFLSSDFIKAQQTVSAADSYISDISKEISESDFSPTVINACGTQAKTNGYALKITLYSKSGNKVSYSFADGAEHVTAPDEYVLALLQLDYNYQIPTVGISNTHSLREVIK